MQGCLVAIVLLVGTVLLLGGLLFQGNLFDASGVAIGIGGVLCVLALIAKYRIDRKLSIRRR